jgi:hypothetical protein
VIENNPVMAKRKVRISLFADCEAGYCWFKENGQCPFSGVIGKDKNIDVVVDDKNGFPTDLGRQEWLKRANRGQFEIGTCSKHHELDPALPKKRVNWGAPTFINL